MATLNPKTTPISTLPKQAFVIAESEAAGQRIVLVKKGEDGYYPTNLDDPNDTHQRVEEKIVKFNQEIKVSPEQADLMKMGSLFGRQIFLQS